MELTETALTILKKRYFIKDSSGNIVENWDQLCSRIGNFLGETDYDKSLFSRMIRECYFLPNSPTLMNAGTGSGSMSACFVLPVEDSLDKIFDSVKNAAIIHKFGGGTGFSFSDLRQKDSVVGSTQGTASGPVSFISVFNAATEVIKQGSKRRGANMGILNIHHPDIVEFIHAKDDHTKLNNFNLSVAITDEFMDAVTHSTEYNLYEPTTGEIIDTLDANTIFDELVSKAWEGGDPGVIFIDTINKANQVKTLGDLKATNPCGEIVLFDYESCNLGSINLGKYFVDGDVDFDLLSNHVRAAVRFLDSVISKNIYSLPEIEQATKRTRKLGLGIMGLHDLLFKLRTEYASEEGRLTASKIMQYINDVAVDESKKLVSLGAFPAWSDKLGYEARRNATLTSIQPTGTVSMIADCSSGCEPVFSLVSTKKVLDGNEFLMINQVFVDIAKREGFYSDSLIEHIKKTGSLQGSGIDEKWINLFKTAQEIPFKDHVLMQSVLQNNGVDNSISKTINMDNSATKEDVRSVYTLAYLNGCKGVTIYRDGSRNTQVLYTGDDTSQKVTEEKTAIVGNNGLQKAELADVIDAKRFRLKGVDGEAMYLLICFDENERPVEVFAKFPYDNRTELKSKSTMWTTTCRLVSIMLRYGIDIKEIVNQLDKSSGSMRDLPAQLSKLLKTFVSETKYGYHEKCPDCSADVVFKEGCLTCENCGWSKCS